MKTFVLPPGEDWIVDRFVEEWNVDNADIIANSPTSADVIWLLADWCWTRIPEHLLRSKKVLTSIHHIVPEKFGVQQRREFELRDAFTTAYQVPNELTGNFIKPLTNKPIHVIPYWANQKIWRPTAPVQDLRKKYNIPSDEFIIGSFQRDTEGYDLKSPKLEKGPDLLASYIKRTAQTKPVHVVLAGWRRQYVIEKLNEAKIGFTYIEKPPQATVNELYQTLDIYPVTARYEGGPQSLVECGLLGIKCVSRNVGIASMVLSPKAINDDVFLATPEVPELHNMRLPSGYEPFRTLLAAL